MAGVSGRQQGARMGALVGAVGGLVFVLVNAGAAHGFWVGTLRGAGIAAFVVALVLVARAERLGDGSEPTDAQLRAYWLIVLAEVVAIPLGSLLLVRVLGLGNAGLPWVAIVLGLHFVGFARVFPGAGFLLLGVTATALGVAGLVLAVAGAALDPIRLVAGVATGFVLLLAVLRGVALGRRTPA